MASLKIKYRHSSIEGKAGTLFYQVIHNRVARQINSGYKIYPDEWDIFNSQIIIPAKTGENRHRYLVSLKKCIEEDTSRLKDIMIRFENLGYKYTADEIIEYYSAPPVNEYFVSFCENLIEELRQIGKIRTTETYTTTLNSFKRFMNFRKKGRDIPFDNIDSNLMMEYEQYLKSNDICPNSTSYYMRNLRAMYNRAVEKELVIQRYPFKHVFTPVYNRKNLIGNLYQSLLSQTYKNFEWIIVDDGSTDDIDEIIKSYQNEDRILIRFIKQENGGKHRAINNGVLHAKGELFYIVDSDDYLTKDSIERIVFHYQYIKNNDKFAGVCGMKCFPDGSRIGKEVTWKILKDSWINYWIIKNIKGDVAFVFKTSVLRNYLFDDIPGEKFCAESLVLNRIGKNYLMLFFNEKIYIAEYLSDGLSVSSIKNRMNSPNYAMRIYSEMASLDIPYLKKIKAHINYWRFAPCSKLKMKNKIKQIGIYSYIIFMPIGYLFHMKDKKNNYIDIRHVGSKR